MTDQSDPVAQLERHGDVAQRLDDDDVGGVAPDRAARLAQEGLLQRSRLGVEDGKFHPRALRLDVRSRTRHHQLLKPAYRYCPCPGPPWPLLMPGGSALWRICS